MRRVLRKIAAPILSRRTRIVLAAARTMMRVFGQRRRSRLTSSLRIAAACVAPSIRLGRREHASIAWPQNTYNGR